MEIKITVITVTYNCHKLLQKTIDSVINQSYSNLEYILIDGASTDSTIDIIRSNSQHFNFWISERDQGIYDAMNKGVACASGDYVIFMNAGDTFFSHDTVTSVVSYLKSDLDFIYGDANMILSFGSYRSFPSGISDKDFMPFCHQAVFVRKSLLIENPFDLRYKICADRHLFYRLYKKKCKSRYVSSIICNYEAENGLSSSNLILREYEKGLITGENKRLLWKINHLFFILLSTFKIRIKSIFPTSIVNMIRKCNASRIYNK